MVHRHNNNTKKKAVLTVNTKKDSYGVARGKVHKDVAVSLTRRLISNKPTLSSSRHGSLGWKSRRSRSDWSGNHDNFSSSKKERENSRRLHNFHHRTSTLA